MVISIFIDLDTMMRSRSSSVVIGRLKELGIVEKLSERSDIEKHNWLALTTIGPRESDVFQKEKALVAAQCKKLGFTIDNMVPMDNETAKLKYANTDRVLLSYSPTLCIGWRSAGGLAFNLSTSRNIADEIYDFFFS